MVVVVGSLSRLADGTGSNSGEEKLRGSGDLGETTELVETMVGRDEGERPSTDPPFLFYVPKLVTVSEYPTA